MAEGKESLVCRKSGVAVSTSGLVPDFSLRTMRVQGIEYSEIEVNKECRVERREKEKERWKREGGREGRERGRERLGLLEYKLRRSFIGKERRQ